MPLHASRACLALTFVLAAAMALPACGGGDGGSSAPEEVREQDSRQFSVDATTLPFAALAGAPETDRWWGVLGGAGYRVEQAAAFDAMADWAQNGVKPAGDEVLDRATVADPAYGCRFSSSSRTPNSCPAS